MKSKVGDRDADVGIRSIHESFAASLRHTDGLRAVTASLAGADIQARLRILDWIAALDEDVPELVPLLTPLLSDPELIVSVRAAAGLCAIAPQSVEILKVVEPLVTHRYPFVREVAIAGLGKVSRRHGIPVDTTLVAGAFDQARNVRSTAARQIGKCGSRSLQALVSASRSPEQRLLLCEAIQVMGPVASSAVPVLETHIRERLPGLLVPSLEALAAIGLAATNALKDTLGSDDCELAESSVRAIAQMGSNAEYLLEDLVKTLAHRSGRVRNASDWALRRLGPAVVPVAPRIARWLREPHAVKRKRAAAILSAIGPDARFAEDLLSGLLATDPDNEVRSHAAQALGQLAKPSQTTLRALAVALSSGAYHVRLATTKALRAARYEVPTLVPLVVDNLVDKRQGLSQESLRLLERYGTQDAHARAVAIERLHDNRHGIRWAAASVISRMGSAAAAAVPHLVGLCGDHRTRVRVAAARAIGLVASDAPLSIAALLGLLADRRNEVRAQAVWSIGRFGKAASSTVPALVARLKDTDYNVSRQVVITLGVLRETASEAIPALRQVLNEQHALDRSLVEQAILRIESGIASTDPWWKKATRWAMRAKRL